MRALILAVQFLTRLPTPQLADFNKDELSTTARWFPVVGLIIGALVTAMMLLGTVIDPWLGTVMGLITWVWITGALHLDGLADLMDALGAAHRDPQRFLQVMRDPHLGSFGVIALIVQLISKLILLKLIMMHDQLNWYLLPLVCAWARLGAIAWSAWLPSLSSGSAEAFSWKTNQTLIIISACTLLLLSAWLAPGLVLAPCVLLIWWLFLRYNVGGMTGDCLGAGIEVTENLMLLIALISPFILKMWILK